MSYLDSFDSYVNLNFSKLSTHIPEREKHFNTVVFVVVVLILSEIPLIGSLVTAHTSKSEVVFQVSGTLMELGTRPFMLASLFSSSLPNEYKHSCWGLIVSWLMAIQWSYANNNIIGGIQLCTVGWCLHQAEVYLDRRGSLSSTGALILANSSSRIVSSTGKPLLFIWTIVMLLIVQWIHMLHVRIPMISQKQRSQPTAAQLPIMYNSTTALILYYTFVETVASWYTPFYALLGYTKGIGLVVVVPFVWCSIWFINKHLSTAKKRDAKDIIGEWSKQNYTMKGWRNKSAMYKHIQKLISRNVVWNTIIICSMWTLGLACPSAVGVTSLFSVVSEFKYHQSQLTLL